MNAQCEADIRRRHHFFSAKWCFALMVMQCLVRGSTIVVSTSTLINVGITNYDGSDLIVSNCTLTINGPHSFNSVLLTNNAVLTNTAGVTNTFLVVSNNMTIDTTSRVDVSGSGYGSGSGPGAGGDTNSGDYYYGGGGGYGGQGGNSAATGAPGGSAYGSLIAPTNLGSGGGHLGGAGGGAIQLAIGGTLAVNGSIKANGISGNSGFQFTGYCSGGGSGGSIYLTSQTFAGNGVITANGGASMCGIGGGGSGGRIAAFYTNSSYTGSFTVTGGSGAAYGGAGTIFLSSNSITQLIVDGGGTPTPTPTPINAPGLSASVLVQGGAQLLVNGNVILGGNLTVNGTNSVADLFETNVVAESVSLTNGGLLTHLAGASNTVLIVSNNMTIDALSRVDISSNGYGAGAGPGAGTEIFSAGAYYGSGGGYGGVGGNSSGPGGTNYGSLTTPTNLGSGGGSGGFSGEASVGGFGGGAIELLVGGTLMNNGIITANGSPQSGTCFGGGGSGGSIYLETQTIAGNGMITANGGSSCLGGGGGGGRIACYFETNQFTGGFSVSGGTGGQSGQPGTFYPTPIDAQLALSQQVYGRIDSPSIVDRWLFSATAGQQVRLQQIGVTPSGLVFDLNGPDGWSGFFSITNQSPLVTLTNSGEYNLTVRAQNLGYHGEYTFVLEETTETNILLDTPFLGSFIGNGQAQIIIVSVTNSGPLLINLNNAGASNTTELYAQLGSPPTRGAYTWSSINPNSPNQQILIPNALAGTYYILAYGNQITSPGAYSVDTQTGTVFLTSATPYLSAGNTPVILTLNGAGFLPSSTVALISSNGAVFQPSSVTVDSFTQITANVPANELPNGTYSIQITSPSGASTTLADSFNVVTGQAQFSSSLTVPAVSWETSPSTIHVQYGNVGTAQMSAPLIVLTAQQNGFQDARLGLDGTLLLQAEWTSAQQPTGFFSSPQFLASGQVPGTLQPNESITVPLYWAGWHGPFVTHGVLHWNLSYITADDPTPIDWPSLASTIQPPSIPSDAWQATFAAFTNLVGATWGDYVTTLDNDAAYFGRLGIDVSDVSKLFAFQLLQADGLCPIQTLASSVDASVPAPGLPLTFTRSYGERISQRYAVGVFGRGWVHNWQYSLQTNSDGSVTIFGPNNSERLFQLDTRGGYFNQAGDYGTLSAAGGGAFTLTEKSGLLSFYNANGQLAYVQDLNSNKITLGYTGNLLSSLTNSSGQYINFGYNNAKLIQTVTDNFGHQTVLTYDSANQYLTGAQYFDGRTATYMYNTSGTLGQLHALTAMATTCCNWRYFNYDSYGRLTGTYLANNANAITIVYESGGLVTVLDGLGDSTQYFYDNNGMLNAVIDALGNSVHLAYDANYNLLNVTDPFGHSYNYTYDNLGNIIQSTDSSGNVTHFAYSSTYNRFISVTDANGNSTKYSYDSRGNLLSITYADDSIESWTYDAVGELQTWKNRRGQQTVYTFNNSGELLGKTFADGSATSYSYDAQGDLTNTTTFDTNLNVLEPATMIYDGSNRLSQIVYRGGKFLNFTYDSDGRRLSSEDQLGHTLLYSYDDAGRLQGITNELNAPAVLYRYDAAGRIAMKTLGNGIFTTYNYDPVGHLMDLTNFSGDGTVISSFDYTYDGRGRRATMSTLDGTWTYTYDDIWQLIHAVYSAVTTDIPNQDLTYIYDSVGNRMLTIENGATNSCLVNNINQYLEVGRTNYTFDADGNLTKEVSPEGIITYTYNEENRLISMTSPQGTWIYSYDGSGNRLGKTENETNTQYVVDPIALGNVVGEYDGNGNLIAHYDHALGLLARVDQSGNSAGYSFDGMGNVQEMASSEGSVTNSYAYGPFGILLQNIASAPNPFQFNGEFGVSTEDNGLSFMRARYYEAGIGRFQTADPIGISGGLNLYCYSLNNSLTFADPSGFDPLMQCLQNCYKWDLTIAAGTVWLNLRDLGSKLTKSVPGRFITTYGGRLSGAAAGRLSAVVGAALAGYALGTAIDCTFQCTAVPSGSSPSGPLPNTCSFAQCTNGGSATSESATPGDPNSLIGPTGFGVQAFVTESNLFGYSIYFENETNASAAAQDVEISDPLPDTLDWQTFHLGEIAFGNVFIPIPPNVQYFQTNVPLTIDGTSFDVFIDAGINLASGEVFANFFSINPATGLPPTNGVGFLPPDDANGDGRGHIAYTIRPTPDLPQGTQIPNVAYVQFDGNAAIATDQVSDTNASMGVDTNKEAIVTIDNSVPYSSVIALPSITTTTNFQVCWTGTDSGSAVVAYDIYASTNYDGPWTLWQSQTTNMCAEFQGEVGDNYYFYSVAYNGVGTIQPTPTNANTKTLIVLPPQICVVSNEFISVGQQLVITNCAEDPYQPITFGLGQNSPAGASVTADGVFTWTPSCGQASTTNLITIWATDSYSTPLSNSASFTVVVSDCLQVSIGSTVMQVGTTNSVPASVISTLGLTNLSFIVVYPTNRFTNWAIIPRNSAIGTALVQGTGSSQAMFNIAAGTGQTITGPATLGSLSFTALPGCSAFVPLAITNVVGIKADGTPVGNSSGQAGAVVVIGIQPLLEALLDTNSTRILTVYGNPGSNYQLFFTTNIGLTNWSPGGSVSMTNLQQNINPNQVAPQIYYQAQ